MIRLLFAALLLSCGGLLASCNVGMPASDVSSASAVGIWDLQGPQGKVATLTFRPDGTFSAFNMPKDAFDRTATVSGPNELAWSDPVEYVGTWTFRDYKNEPKIEIVSTYLESPVPLWINTHKSKLQLITLAGGCEGNMIFRLRQP